MTLLSIGWGVVVSIGLVLALAASIRFLVVPPDSNGWLHIDMNELAEKRGEWVQLLVYVMLVLAGLMLFIVLPQGNWPGAK
jgi:hypothetical protein